MFKNNGILLGRQTYLLGVINEFKFKRKF